MVAWCYDCDVMICQLCESSHKKLAIFREHHVIGNKEGQQPIVSKSSYCPRHIRVELNYWCTSCSELVCAECLLREHNDHQYSLAEEARHTLETRIKELAGLVTEKKQEFSDYLEKASEAEG